MRLLNLRINFYLLRTFCPHLGRFFLCCFFFHYVSAKFHLRPSSGDLPRPRIGMLILVTVSPVITAFHSCCLSHHVFDQVNLWPASVGFETAIFWQDSVFLSYRVHVGNSPAPGPSLKRPCAILIRLVGRKTNTSAPIIVSAPLQLLGHTAASRVVHCMVHVGFPSSMEILPAPGDRLPRL